ncbi:MULTISPECIES: 5-formyltetrahydrofolate cyclo-ligase [unclassified Sphingopyxis]|uniref:5-formyltetrahydrofolate cyclo-ligase n=1 Tax=unclassified Sphingopyxis TaxID=2614943 RepID=UPI0007372B6D|nr:MULTISPECIES: 5-formyltetrahydrofolate cyclo-ligase [unclassified Sphingopyxis]KTE33003.1 5-formyltetrahydrofolate cyclo-ligase [Sphingopyxis sp. HIX]KTE83428.1 5-formyltetrahydrofolate cyclo-ligase [Sphingopyxis sp. HXXIV]
MTDMSGQKQQLRERLRFRRRHFASNLDEFTRFAAFRAIPAPLAELLDIQPVIGAYSAWGDEPDILQMLGDHAATGKLALPHHEGRIETMGFRRWNPGDALVNGPWSSRQPADDAESAVPTLLFCPLVGFDRRGGRIGQGGGHYDRWFAAHPDALRIGIGWSVQEVDAMPLEATDMPLDAVLTEQEFIVTGERL